MPYPESRLLYLLLSDGEFCDCGIDWCDRHHVPGAHGGPRQRPLAAMPIFFAVQQGIEGALWLTLQVAEKVQISTGLALLYLLFAQSFWPVYAPVAALLAEPDVRRRRLMLVCAGLGGAVSLYLLWSVLARPHAADIVNGHVVSVTEKPFPLLVGFVYLAATALPLLLSSHRVVTAFGSSCSPAG